MAEQAPGFIVAHSHRLEDLTDIAVSFIERFPLAPLEQESILVQSNGIAQWLKINLAQHAGIASMIDVTLPARFQWQAYRAVLGDDIPRTSPFDKARLSWRLLRLLPDIIEQDTRFTPLKNYVSDDLDNRKLYQLSERLADLFDQYAIYRADWLDSWLNGQDVLDRDEPVAEAQAWQPELWRRVAHDIGVEHLWNNRATLHQQFIKSARALNQRPLGIPPRIMVFGISSLPQQMLEVLDALKHVSQVVLCVHNPSKFYWADIVDGKEQLKQVVKAKSRLAHKPGMPLDWSDEELHQLAHPLLASWGKQGRDYIRLLDLYDESVQKKSALGNMMLELFEPHATEHALGQLQDDILNLRPLHETQQAWAPLSEHDHSVQFHICHSPQREVEVLHDRLLAAFAADPELKPRDVMVMLPDVDTYAPYIDAVFGRYARSGDSQDTRAIPYTIADQTSRHRAPLLIALELLLSSDQLRFTQTDMLTLLSTPAIQRRFDIDDDDIEQLRVWMNESGGRWGLSAEHRSQFFMPEDDETNSWWFAIKRMMVGYSVGYAELDSDWQNIAPYADIGGLGADLVGRFSYFVEQLDLWWERAREPRSYNDWVPVAEWLVETFFETEEPGDALLKNQVVEQLYQVAEHVDEADNATELTIALFRESWLARVDEHSLNQRFLAGAVNFATLMPMRAIPFKFVAVLGMNESDYPRNTSQIDFDLMASRYRPGDRSRRDDDRYLFLEALLSARDVFYVSWVGFSARDNSERTPSVLVAQLREHIQQGWRTDLAEHTWAHKLQPFNRAYFDNDTRVFSYASEWAQAHDATSLSSSLAQGIVQADESAERTVNLNDIKRFVQEPARLFFNTRLETYFSVDADETTDREAFQLDALTEWKLIQRVVDKAREAVRQGHEPEQAIDDELARIRREGALGTSAIAERHQRHIEQQVEDILATYRIVADGYTRQDTTPYWLDATFNQITVEEGLEGLHWDDTGQCAWIITTASQVAAKKADDITDSGWKHFASYYVGHLLLNRRQPTVTHIVSRGGCHFKLPPIEPNVVNFQLDALTQLIAQAYREPIAMHLDLARIYLKAISKEDNAAAADAAAREYYEVGSSQRKPLLETAEYCARAATSFDEIRENPHFMAFIDNLYRPMFEFVAQQGGKK